MDKENILAIIACILMVSLGFTIGYSVNDMVEKEPNYSHITYSDGMHCYTYKSNFLCNFERFNHATNYGFYKYAACDASSDQDECTKYIGEN